MFGESRIESFSAVQCSDKENKRIIYFEISSNPERESTRRNLFVRHFERRYRDIVSVAADAIAIECNSEIGATRTTDRHVARSE